MKTNDGQWSDEEESECGPQNIVIDNGSHCIKAGFDIDDRPWSVSDTLVGRQKYRHQTSMKCHVFVGYSCNTTRCILDLFRPIQKGHIVDFDDMERVWNYTLRNELRIEQYGDNVSGILLADSPVSTETEREKTAEYMFETAKLPRVSMCMGEILSLYAEGITTGLSLSSGREMTYAVPVVEGVAVREAMKYCPVGGQHVTDYLTDLLKKREDNTWLNKDRVMEMKYTHCAVNEINHSPDVFNFLSKYWGPERNPISRVISEYCFDPENIMLKDRTGFKKVNIEWDSSDPRCGGYDEKMEYIYADYEVRQAPEILFNPSIRGVCDKGIHHIAHDAISACDASVRDALCKEIRLNGGNTKFTGLDKRIKIELKSLDLRGIEVGQSKSDEPGIRNQTYNTWVGGTMLSKLSTFDKWITKDEYEESGPSIVRRKYCGQSLF